MVNKKSLQLTNSKLSIETLVPEYRKLVSALQKEITHHLETIKEYFDYQTITIHHTVGRQVVEHLRKYKLGENPSEALYASLGKDLKMSKRILQYCVQFYKEYPKLPARQKNLTWTHYTMLLAISDPKARERLQKEILRKNLSSTALRELIRGLRSKEDADELSEASQNLTLVRGDVYFYRIIQASFVKDLSPSVSLDCGFNICIDYLLSDGKRYESGQVVRSIKNESTYAIELTKVPKDNLYTYKAIVERVVDGDTLLVKIDVGFGIYLRERLRLRGVNAPEVKTAQGDETKVYVEKVLGLTKFIVIKTYRVEKYGRYLADVFYLPPQKPDPERQINSAKLPQENLGAKQNYLLNSEDVHQVAEEGTFLNQELLDKGLAESYDGQEAVE